MEKDTENKIHDLLSSPAGKERTPQPTGAPERNTAELRPTPIIDLTAARERADARRKKLEAEEKRIEEQRRISAWQRNLRRPDLQGARSHSAWLVSAKIYRAVRIFQVIFIFVVLAYLARSCGFV